MCGIAGIYRAGTATPDDTLALRVDGMLRRLAFRGPDQEGRFVGERCALGIARLIINGDRQRNAQPRRNARGALVFNGEIYNFPKLGALFGARSEVDALASVLEDGDVSALARLDGMFALAYYREADQSLLLARNPVGKKPLYLAQANGGHVFASTLRAMRTELPKPRVREAALHEYLVYRSVGGDRTVLQDVEAVPPGSWVRLHPDGRVDRGRYWTAPVPQGAPSECDPDEIADVMEEAVRARLSYDGPVAVLLSGGFDSSLVAALAARLRGGERMAAFAVGYDLDDGADETGFAARMAGELRLPFERVEVRSDEVPGLIEECARYLEDPVQDPVVVPTLRLAQRIKQFSNVVLTGDGADEIWGGYERFDRLPPSLGQYFPRTTIFRPEELGLGEPPQSYLDQVLEAAHHELPVGDAVQRLEVRNRMKNYHLSRVDKLTMSQALEARCPFLDRKMVELGLRLPFNAKRPQERPKGLLIDTFGPLLPAWLTQRRKQPFSLPMVRLLSGPLREYAGDTLCNPRSCIQRYVNGAGVLRDFLCSPCHDGAHKVWSLLFLDAWHRSFFQHEERHVHLA